MGLRSAIISSVLMCACASFAIAGPIAVMGGAAFTGGLNGSWDFQYTAGAPDLLLESITLDLSPTDLRFDTAAGGFGSGSYRNVGGFGGTDASTGLSSLSAAGAALDGGVFITFTFSNFTPGSSFRFSSDVDHPNPTLLSLVSCAGKTGLALVACNAANAGRTVTNDARLLAAQTVGPNDMTGALVTFQFSGPYQGSMSFSGEFQRLTLGDIIGGLVNGECDPFDSKAEIEGAVVANPEPASMATLGLGLGLLIFVARRRRRAE